MTCKPHRSILVRKRSKAGAWQYTHQCQHCLKIDREANGGTIWVKAPANPDGVAAWVDRFDDGERFLFDVRPEGSPEDVSVKKRPAVVAESVEDEKPAVVAEQQEEPATAFIKQLHGKVDCPSCGSNLLDIEAIVGAKWLVNCSWGCGLRWQIHPIDGVLESGERLHGVRRDLEGMMIVDVWKKNPDWIRAAAKIHPRRDIREVLSSFLLTTI